MVVRLALLGKVLSGSCFLRSKLLFLACMSFPLVYGDNEIAPVATPHVSTEKKFSVAEVVEMFKDPNFKELLSDQYRDFQKDLSHKKRAVDPKTLEEEQERKRFYTDYLAKYYPKVFVIRNQFFAHMTVDQMVIALQEIVDVFTEKPWFYFVDKQDNFVIVRYWEYIVDQLSFVSDFLRKAYVDSKTGSVVLPQSGVSMFGSPFGSSMQARRPAVKSLLQALNERQKKSVHAFYALSFDYLIKLFNEGILLKSTRLASRFLQDLEFVMNKLQGSEFESDYYEVLKTCKELINILRHKYGVEAYDGLDDESFVSRNRSGMRGGY